MSRKKKAEELSSDLPIGLREYTEKVGDYVYKTIRTNVLISDDIQILIRQRFSDDAENSFSRKEAIDWVLKKREQIYKEYGTKIKLPENFIDEVYIDELGRKKSRILTHAVRDGIQKTFSADYGRLYRKVRSKKEAVELVYGKLKLFLESQDNDNE